MQLSILYCNDYIVAINKPSGLLVHRSNIDKYETRVAVQTLRDQLDRKVHPIHRLDKPTSGVLLFGFDAEITKQIASYWDNIDKSYLAITRGNLSDVLLNYLVHTISESGKEKVQQAETDFSLLATMRIPVVFGKQSQQYSHTTFSLVRAQPKTGRKHQIRKHLKHLNYPIIGDTRYGRGEINHYFLDNADINRLMLHCQWMRLTHPILKKPMVLYAPLDASWISLVRRFVF